MNGQDIKKDNDDVKERKIFVGNVHEKVNNRKFLEVLTRVEQLEQFFQQFGKVDKAYVMFNKSGKSRKFGFVEFVHKSTVQKILELQTEIVLNGLILECKEVKLKGEVLKSVSPQI
jgi:RNA recognition motif-containing protein